MGIFSFFKKGNKTSELGVAVVDLPEVSPYLRTTICSITEVLGFSEFGKERGFLDHEDEPLSDKNIQKLKEYADEIKGTVFYNSDELEKFRWGKFKLPVLRGHYFDTRSITCTVKNDKHKVKSIEIKWHDKPVEIISTEPELSEMAKKMKFKIS